MKYTNTVEGSFLDRPNRFLAHVKVSGSVETVHVKNTGRCRELLLPGARVILSDRLSEKRKTRYDLISVYKERLGWVNIDSQAPNAVVEEWLKEGNGIFPQLTLIRPEFKFSDSRVDFYLEEKDRKILMEVKGCTLAVNGEGYFPDAPTERGVKHLRELTSAVGMGYESVIAFVIAMNGISVVHPNTQTHPEFATALAEAKQAGVRELYLCCRVEADELKITEAIEG